MSSLAINLLCCLAAATAGAAGASWIWSLRARRKPFSPSNADDRRGTEVLVRLQELAARVALDVDQHNSQIEEINDRLISIDQHDPVMIIEVVANLVQANELMHMKLATTEDKLREQAEELQNYAAEARTDSLTLLANRRAFDDELTRRTAEFIRLGQPFSLIIADIDHFKEFNDAYGHQTGDDILRSVAKLLRRKMREMDLVARYGGEEFAAIMPGTAAEDACKAALRACQAIGKAIHYGGKELSVTASFGVAEMAPGNDGDLLVGRADRALYAAKHGGRNCVYWDDGNTLRRYQAALPALVPAVPAIADPTAESQPELPSAADIASIPDLPGRTAFCQQVRNRTAEWKRGGPTFSILLLEVNQYAEDRGDRGQRLRDLAMRTTIRFLSATIREMDVLGHYAPGCFALMLPTAGLPNAIRVAERMRTGFTQSMRPADAVQMKLTFSVGIVQVMEKDDSISVLRRAEAALDAADRRGGNRAYYHDGDRCVPITAMLEAIDYLT
jgi:diguanylate cyclase